MHTGKNAAVVARLIVAVCHFVQNALRSASALAGAIDALAKGLIVPIILTSRADSVRSRIASCGVAMLVVHARRAALQAVSA